MESKPTNRIITISDVANHAGVAKSTVSKVIKNYSNVSQQTKDKVHQSIKELNYVPNFLASQLSSKNSSRVALYVYINDQRQAIDEINMQYLFGAFNKAKQLNLELITIFNNDTSAYTTQEFTQHLYSQSITSIVVFGLNKEDFMIHEIINKQLFHVVVVDAPICNEKTSCVSVDHFTGQYAVAKKIIDPKYCHKILYLAGKKNGYVTDARLKGIKQLAEEYNLKLSIHFADFSEKKAYEITKQFGSKHDVIVCASDLMAIGSMNALIDMNIYRKVCGYDGITLMAYAGKQMYTCRQDFRNISTVAMEELHRLILGELGRCVLLDFEIVQLHYQDIIT